MRKNQHLRFVSLLWIIACCAVLARAEERVLVEEFDERPVPVKAYPPAYPPEMLEKGVSGLVNVSVVIDKTGAVIDREVVKSSRTEFERPALDAVRKWKFKPGLKGGNPVNTRIMVPIQFTFQE